MQNSMTSPFRHFLTAGRVLPSTLSLAAMSGPAFAEAESSKPQPPNILVIMADDAGYFDFGFQDNRAFEQITPNFDRLAERGTRFTHAYVTATVCGPSRAGFISGMYQQRVGFQENFPPHWTNPPHQAWRTDAWRSFGLDTSVRTMADYLGDRGYRTGIIGKWHLGYAERFHPNQRGFDYFWGFRSGSRSYFSTPRYNETERVPQRYASIEENGTLVPESEITYLTEDLTARALEFITAAAEENQRYFLFLSHLAPHTPMHATEPDLETARELFPDEEERRQIYIAMMINLDRGVGALLDRIDELGQTENTLIVFLSDNGGPLNNASDNTPLRGHKFSPFEAGSRVPMLISWPGVLPEKNVFDPVVSSLDLLPTFLDVSGHESVEGLDGISLLPWLRSGDLTEFPARDLFWRENTLFAATEWIRAHEEEKAIWYAGERGWRTPRPEVPSFFNLSEDPGEENDLGPEAKERVRELRERYDAWTSELAPPRW